MQSGFLVWMLAMPLLGQTVMPAPKVGSSDPAACITGELFFNTSASAGSNIKGCTATNTWTAQGGSGSPSSTVLTPVAFASIPSAGTAGRIQFFTDAAYVARDNGSTWDYWCNSAPCAPATATSFATTVNTTGATFTDQGNGEYVLTGTADTGVNTRAWVKSIPSAPYTITALITVYALNGGYGQCGLVLRQSSDGKLVDFGWTSGNTDTEHGIIAQKMTSPTATSANYTLNAPYYFASSTAIFAGIPLWLRIVDNNTNRILSISPDGVTWLEVHSVSRTDFLTPDQVGFYCDSQLSNKKPVMVVRSYRES